MIKEEFMGLLEIGLSVLFKALLFSPLLFLYKKEKKCIFYFLY